MNFLFVNNQFNLFSNVDCGASQRSMCIIRALSQNGHVDVVSFLDNTVSDMLGVDVLYSRNIPNSSESYGGRLSKFLILLKYKNPYSIYPINIEKKQVLDEIISRKKYDFIVVRYVHYACECGLLKHADKLIIDIDDDPKDVVLMSLDKIKTIRNKFYHRLYASTVQAATNNVVSKIHYAFFSTPDKKYPKGVFLPNISVFKKPLSFVDFTSVPPRLLIVGWFKYFPNVEGLKHFVCKVFPMVRKEIHNVELDVVGKMSDDDLIQLCERTDGVNKCGYVEDLRSMYDKCRCVIVPLYKGTGTSVKLVEAISMGRAVVTTPVGMRGLHHDFKENQDFLLARSDEEFALCIIRLLEDEELNRRIVNSALINKEKHYSEKAFNNIVASSLKT